MWKPITGTYSQKVQNKCFFYQSNYIYKYNYFCFSISQMSIIVYCYVFNFDLIDYFEF